MTHQLYRGCPRARVLVADPAWLFGDALPGNGRGASDHYDCETIEDICRMPLPPMHDDSVLVLWRVAAMQLEACTVARMWGFKVKGEMVWDKMTTHGKQHWGMGRQGLRGSHESCLLATRGRPFFHGEHRTRFEAKVGEHSGKPDKFYEVVEHVWPGPYVELFARRKRRGWRCYGNEI